MIFKPKSTAKLTQLKAQIKQLQKENALLRASLHEIVNIAYHAINPEAEKGGDHE